MRSFKTISDGKCKAVPTKYEQIASLRPEGWIPDESTKPAVRLVELALMGRTEGTIRSIHSDYAFITCAERNVDAYVKLFEVFPNELHSGLVKNNPELFKDDTNDCKTAAGLCIVRKVWLRSCLQYIIT